MASARLLLVGLVILICACACSPSEGEDLARRIQDVHSPLVVKVVVRPANLLDPETVDVYLRSGTTEAEAVSFWCTVIDPHGEGTNVPVALWNQTGTAMLASDPTCPRPSPSTTFESGSEPSRLAA